MIDFRQITISDREWIEPLLRMSNFRGSEYTFSNNYNWRDIYGIKVARMNDYYLVRSGKGDYRSYLYPAGSGDIKPVIEALIEDAKENDREFIMHGLTDETVAQLSSIFPDRFEITATRDNADYIYLAEKLSTLSGKKLHSKRNHIARFKDNNWEYESINENNIDDCIKMNSKWCKENDCSVNKSLQEEACSVKNAFMNFKAEDLKGGLLRIDGEVIAYTIGTRLNSDTFIVHIEKAFSGIQGAYPMINQQFVQHECEDYMYVNREDDLGEEGLRKAKLSYYPHIILEKYEVRLK